MILQSKASADFKPHAEGIYPAVCVDVIDLGVVESEFQGQKRLVNKVRLVFETEEKNEEGKNCTLAKTFTASLNAKAKLAEFLGKWRGRPVVPGETIDLGKLLGVCCTLVISHQENLVGRTYASIDAVSKPTKKLVASGHYDPVLARQRIAEWKAKEMQGGSQGQAGQAQQVGRSGAVAGSSPVVRGQSSLPVNDAGKRRTDPSAGLTPLAPVQASGSGAGSVLTSCTQHNKMRTDPSAGPAPAQPVKEDYDPDVGF